MRFCEHCLGDEATTTRDLSGGYRPETPLCAACARDVDNYDPTPWELNTEGTSARELNDPTHPRNREAWDAKRG